MRPVADENKQAIVNMLREGTQRILFRNVGVVPVLTGIGDRIASMVQRKITQGPHQDLADSTKERRRKGKGTGGFSGHNPLVDTGHLRASVGIRVVQNGMVSREKRGG